MIDALAAQLVAAWRETSWLECIAAILAVAYLLLAIRQLAACWHAAFVSSVLYVWVFSSAHLYMDSVLNVFYALTAGYGFWQWRLGRGAAELAVTRWAPSRHVWALATIIGLSLTTSFFLRRFTAAAWPFIDSMVSWASVFSTYLVARKVYENWYWWLVIDSVSLCLYFSRGLYLTALLFGLYLVLIVVGLREWRRSLPVSHAIA